MVQGATGTTPYTTEKLAVVDWFGDGKCGYVDPANLAADLLYKAVDPRVQLK